MWKSVLVGVVIGKRKYFRGGGEEKNWKKKRKMKRGGERCGGAAGRAEGVCAILLRLYTSTEHLKRIYTSPQPIFELTYFKENMY
jgi:hypothetical protein